MRLERRKFAIPLLQYRLGPFLRVGFILKQILHRLANEGITGQFSVLRHAFELSRDSVQWTTTQHRVPNQTAIA